MTSCVISKCKYNSRVSNKSTGITFHSFPKDEIKRQKWIKVVRIDRDEEYWVPSSNSKICSAHFSTEDMYFTPKGLRWLKPNANPRLQVRGNPERQEECLQEPKSPGSLKDVDISDLEPIFDTPCEAFLKKKVAKLYLQNRKLVLEKNKIKKINKRLQAKCETMKYIIKTLKHKNQLQDEHNNELSIKNIKIEFKQNIQDEQSNEMSIKVEKYEG